MPSNSGLERQRLEFSLCHTALWKQIKLVSLSPLYKATLSKRKSAESKPLENKWETPIQGNKKQNPVNSGPEKWDKETDGAVLSMLAIPWLPRVGMSLPQGSFPPTGRWWTSVWLDEGNWCPLVVGFTRCLAVSGICCEVPSLWQELHVVVRRLRMDRTGWSLPRQQEAPFPFLIGDSNKANYFR